MGFRNKQPFYHRVDGLEFKTEQSLKEEDFLNSIKKYFKKFGALPDTFEIEYDIPSNKPCFNCVAEGGVFVSTVDGLLFTSTTGFGEEEFKQGICAALSKFVFVGGCVVLSDGYAEPEAGDPCDLM